MMAPAVIKLCSRMGRDGLYDHGASGGRRHLAVSPRPLSMQREIAGAEYNNRPERDIHLPDIGLVAVLVSYIQVFALRSKISITGQLPDGPGSFGP